MSVYQIYGKGVYTLAGKEQDVQYKVPSALISTSLSCDSPRFYRRYSGDLAIWRSGDIVTPACPSELE
jgi:hypothetical protein